MKTYIIGHQKPDTDAVVATMALKHLYENCDQVDYQNLTPVITDPLNPETTFVFEKFSATHPQIIAAPDISKDDKVILADHNEESQRLSNLNPEQIISIVDHHKINLNLNTPISLIFRPWGSTCTVIYYQMKLHQVTPDKTLAALMLSAILSDTVGFKSVTTTKKDRLYSQELAELAGIKEIDDFTLELFKAKSNVASLTDNQIVNNDYKIYDFSKKVLINQIETVDQPTILKRKAGLLKAMSKLKSDLKLDLVYCAITDILKINTKLLCLSDQESSVAQSAFGGKVGESILDIGTKMSRKKEIAPPIEKVLSTQ